MRIKRKRKQRLNRNRRLLTGVIALVLALALPAAALAEDIQINIGQGNLDIYETDYCQYNPAQMDTQEEPVTTAYNPATDRFIITGQSAATEDQDPYQVFIAAASDSTVNLVIEDLSIENEYEYQFVDENGQTQTAQSERCTSPILIASGNVVMELEGTNTLSGGNGKPGIETAYAEGEGSLTITDKDNDGSLTATGSMATAAQALDENGNTVPWEDINDDNINSLTWQYDGVGVSPGIGGSVYMDYKGDVNAQETEWVYERDSDGHYIPDFLAGDGVGITIDTDNVTARAGEVDEWVAEQYPEMAGLTVPGVGYAAYILSDGTVVKGNEHPAEPDPVSEPVKTDVTLGGNEAAKVVAAGATVTEETAADGTKAVAVTFDKSNGFVELTPESLSAIVEAGFAKVQVKVRDKVVSIDLAALQARLGEGYSNIVLKIVGGKLVLTAVGPDGKTVNLSDLLIAA